MTIEIVVPSMGESISEATVANWLKQPGASVSSGEILVELETDKVMVEVPAPQAGVIASVSKPSGSVVTVGEVLAILEPSKAGNAASASGSAAPTEPARVPPPSQQKAAVPAENAAKVGPAVRRLAEEQQVDLGQLQGTGVRGQVTKADFITQTQSTGTPVVPPPASAAATTNATAITSEQTEKRVPMSRLRMRIAERLVMAQQTAAMLTTFNEVDLKALMDLRARYKTIFQEAHGTSLGFMGFFTKACVQALKEIPVVNAELDQDTLIYKYHYDIGVAVSTERGLVVPVVRGADQLSHNGIEKEIMRLAEKARNNKLSLDDLTGGTFTISNGGVYGSLLSTPILNPPQVAILGMHNIVKRAMVVDDQIVIRPMMYLALSYDHRVVDGKEAVQFLVKVKQRLEDPARMLLEV